MLRILLTTSSKWKPSALKLDDPKYYVTIQKALAAGLYSRAAKRVSTSCYQVVRTFVTAEVPKWSDVGTSGWVVFQSIKVIDNKQYLQCVTAVP